MPLQPGSLTGPFQRCIIPIRQWCLSVRAGFPPRAPAHCLARRVFDLSHVLDGPPGGGERSFASTLQPHTADVIEDRRAVACQMLNDEARAWLCEQPGEPSLSFDQRQDGRFAA